MSRKLSEFFQVGFELVPCLLIGQFIILAFRAAIHCELLKEEEVKILLQDRKREEAKLVKREAQKDDFINFVARRLLKFNN